MKNHFSILLVSLSLLPFNIKAQAYGTAIGVRLADGFGVSLQQQIAVHTTAEVILQSALTGKKDVTLTVLGEQHNSLLTRGFNFYLGGGVYTRWMEKDENLIKQPKNPWGIAPIMGLELTLGNLNLSADFKPNIKLSGDGDVFEWRTGISVRYVMAGRFFKNDNWKFWKKW